jgi:hypothetical protein
VSSSGAIRPTLVRFRTALAEMYGARIERIVLYGARAAMRGRIPITTFAVLWRMWTAAAGNFTGSPISAGVSVINAMAYDVGAYRAQSPSCTKSAATASIFDA